jgi:hypothetical protein
MSRSPSAPACDHATAVATAVMQIYATANSTERKLRIAQYLRDELDGLAQQIAADRGGCDDD